MRIFCVYYLPFKKGGKIKYIYANSEMVDQYDLTRFVLPSADCMINVKY